MSLSPSVSKDNLEMICKQVGRMEGVQYVTVLDHMGNRLGENSQKYVSGVSKERLRSMYMQIALETSLEKEQDEVLSHLEYSVTNRKDITMVSIPKSNFLILMFITKDLDHKKIVNKAMNLFNVKHP